MGHRHRSTAPARAGCIAPSSDVYSRRSWLVHRRHLRTGPGPGRPDMARWRRRPVPGGTVLHADHGCQYTSWHSACGCASRAARPWAWRLLRHPLANPSQPAAGMLDQQNQATRRDSPARLRMDRGLVQPPRRHSALGYHSPVTYEKGAPNAARSGSMITTAQPTRQETGEAQGGSTRRSRAHIGPPLTTRRSGRSGRASRSLDRGFGAFAASVFKRCSRRLSVAMRKSPGVARSRSPLVAS